MADKGKGKGFWRRLATVAAVMVVTTPVAALLLPFDGTIRYQVQESLAFLIMFGWWLYLPGMVVYALALPRLVRRTSWSPRVVAILACPLIPAVPLLGVVALRALGGSDPGDSQAISGVRMLGFLFLPSLVTGAVVPLPKPEASPNER